MLHRSQSLCEYCPCKIAKYQASLYATHNNGRTSCHGDPLIQKSIGVNDILWMVSLSSSSTSHKFRIFSSLTTLLTCHPGFLFGKERHSPLRCPAFWQWKHSPFSMQHFFSSRVSFPMQMTSTSITLGSLIFRELGVKG